MRENKLCSGHGTCQCSQCLCDPLYRGKFCESSSESTEENNGLCIFYEECVRCIINRKLGNECQDLEKVCSSKDGYLYDSEFFEDISGKFQ